ATRTPRTNPDWLRVAAHTTGSCAHPDRHLRPAQQPVLRAPTRTRSRFPRTQPVRAHASGGVEPRAATRRPRTNPDRVPVPARTTGPCAHLRRRFGGHPGGVRRNPPEVITFDHHAPAAAVTVMAELAPAGGWLNLVPAFDDDDVP